MKKFILLTLLLAIFTGNTATAQAFSERRSVLPTVVRAADDSDCYELKRRDGTIVPGSRFTAIGTEFLCDSYAIRPSCPVPVRDGNGKWGLIDINGNVITPCIYDYMSIPAGKLIQVRQGDLTGYIDYSGNIVIPLKYTSISDRHPFNGYIVADADLGISPAHIYDTRGNLVKKAHILSSTPKDCRIGSIFITGTHETGFSLWDAATRKIIAGPYDFLWMDGNLARFTKGEKVGILDALTGKIMLPAISDRINLFGGYRYTDAVVNGVSKIIDMNGNKILQLPEGLTFADDRYIGNALSTGRIVIADSDSQQRGLIDTDGNMLIPCRYNDISSMNIRPQNPFIICMKDNITDYYDTKNFNVVVSLKRSGDNCAIIGNSKLKNALGGPGKNWRVYKTDSLGTIVLLDYKNNQYAIVNRDGELLLDGINRLGYQGGDTEIPGIYTVSLDNDPEDAGMRLYDATRRKFVSKAILDDRIVTADGNTAVIGLNNNSEMVLFYNSLTGETVCRNAGGQPYNNSGGGIIWIIGNDHIIAVNNEGYELFRMPRGDYSVGKFSDDLSRVFDERTRLYGFIDRTGRTVIPCDMDYADDFHDGLALFVTDGRAGFIDKSGAVVIPCEFDQATSFENSRAVVKKNGAYGLVDTTGREVMPCIYPEYTIPANHTCRLNTIFMPNE